MEIDFKALVKEMAHKRISPQDVLNKYDIFYRKLGNQSQSYDTNDLVVLYVAGFSDRSKTGEDLLSWIIHFPDINYPVVFYEEKGCLEEFYIREKN